MHTNQQNIYWLVGSECALWVFCWKTWINEKEVVRRRLAEPFIWKLVLAQDIIFRKEKLWKGSVMQLKTFQTFVCTAYMYFLHILLVQFTFFEFQPYIVVALCDSCFVSEMCILLRFVYAAVIVCYICVWTSRHQAYSASKNNETNWSLHNMIIFYRYTSTS